MTEQQIDCAINAVCESLKLPYQLKSEQRLIIKNLVKQKHVLGLLPTGFGKSDCYALAPLVKDKISDTGIRHIAIVISPLRSLIKDQVLRYEGTGIRSLALLRREEITTEQEENLRQGKYSLIFSSPEAILLMPWVDILKRWRENIFLVTVDEAHCLISWGNDFRKSYLRVVELRSLFTIAVVLVLTATATQDMVNDIINHLGLSAVETVAVVPDRPNIYLELKVVSDHIEDMLMWLVDEVKENKEESTKTVIYARSIDTVSKLYKALMKLLGKDGYAGARKSENVRIEMFHGTTDAGTQEDILLRFKAQTPLRIVIATVAFGLGVQVADIGRVIHWGASRTVLSYWQECGQCGRDGRAAVAILYLPPSGLHALQVSKEMREMVLKLKANQSCIRKAILEHLFVNGMDPNYLTDMCNPHCCSNCTAARELENA